MMNMGRRLYKSKTNKVLAGVCGGLAEYFAIDPVIIRVAWIAICFAGGAGIIAYIIAAIVMPPETGFSKHDSTFAGSGFNQAGGGFNQSGGGFSTAGGDSGQPEGSGSFTPGGFRQDDAGSPLNDTGDWKEAPKYDNKNGKVIVGIILVALGAMFLFKQVFHWFDVNYFWPLCLIVVGSLIVFRGRGNKY